MGAADRISFSAFQSLLGFLMRCDLIYRTPIIIIIIVSIPAGFSDALRPGSGCRRLGIRVVSIPAGFSDALRLDYPDTAVSREPRFNPCWVF